MGRITIAPYAVLPDGRRYKSVTGAPDLIAAFKAGSIPHVPQGVVDLIQARKQKQNGKVDSGSTASTSIRESSYALAALEGCSAELAAAASGQRNETLNAIAYRLGRMVARGWIERSEVETALTEAMTANGYIADDGADAVAATLRSGIAAGMKNPHEDLRDQEEEKPADRGRPPSYPRRTLADVHGVFKKWFGAEYDLDAATAAIAAAASERLPGDPLWLLIVAGPGGAKTETVQALAGAGAYVTSTIACEGALLSASPHKQRTKKATGGLLRKIGERGILVIKDFTSDPVRRPQHARERSGRDPGNLRRPLGTQCRDRWRSDPDAGPAASWSSPRSRPHGMRRTPWSRPWATGSRC